MLHGHLSEVFGVAAIDFIGSSREQEESLLIDCLFSCSARNTAVRNDSAQCIQNIPKLDRAKLAVWKCACMGRVCRHGSALVVTAKQTPICMLMIN